MVSLSDIYFQEIVLKEVEQAVMPIEAAMQQAAAQAMASGNQCKIHGGYEYMGP